MYTKLSALGMVPKQSYIKVPPEERGHPAREGGIEVEAKGAHASTRLSSSRASVRPHGALAQFAFTLEA